MEEGRQPGEEDAGGGGRQLSMSDDWRLLPGGELEMPRPRTRCAACRARDDAGPAHGPLPLCFQCYRADLARRRAIEGALDRVIAPSPDAVSCEPRGVVRHFRVPPTPSDVDPRFAALARRRRQAQIAARRALAEPIIDLEQFPVSWRPFVRVAMNA
jgi:hypothetical protein